MSDARKGVDALIGILKGKTNGARLSIEEINDAIAEAGAEASMAGITPEADQANLSPADQIQQSNLNVTTESRDESPKPTFLDNEGPSLDVPLFITRTNARELFGLRPGETVAQAAARKATEG